ncbi:hypothetical protein ACP70R_045371 [Stipagrostis hirtigluma subsp. patula]
MKGNKRKDHSNNEQPEKGDERTSKSKSRNHDEKEKNKSTLGGNDKDNPKRNKKRGKTSKSLSEVRDEEEKDSLTPDGKDDNHNRKEKGHQTTDVEMSECIPTPVGNGKLKVNAALQLTKDAAEEIRQLEFGSMLDFTLDWIPYKLQVHLMNHCEVTPDSVHLVVGEKKFPVVHLVVGEKKFPVTPERVHEILGLPLGGDEVVVPSWTRKLLAPGTGNYIGGEEFDLTANLDTREDLKIFSKKDWSKYVCNKIRSALEKFHDTEIKETTSSVFVPCCGVVLLYCSYNLIYVDTPKEYKTFGICHYTSKDVQALMDKHNIVSLLSGTRVDEKPQRRIVEKVVSSHVRRVRKPCVKKFDTGTHEAGKVCIPDDLPSFMTEFGDAMSKAESFIKKGG